MGETKKHYPTAEDLARSYLAHRLAELLREEKKLLVEPRDSKNIDELGHNKARRYNTMQKYESISPYNPALVEEYSVREIARRNLLIDKREKEEKNNQ